MCPAAALRATDSPPATPWPQPLVCSAHGAGLVHRVNKCPVCGQPLPEDQPAELGRTKGLQPYDSWEDSTATLPLELALGCAQPALGPGVRDPQAEIRPGKHLPSSHLAFKQLKVIAPHCWAMRHQINSKET